MNENVRLLPEAITGNFTPCCRSPVVSFDSIAPARLRPAGNAAVTTVLCKSVSPVLVRVAVSLAVSVVFMARLSASSARLNLGCGFG